MTTTLTTIMTDRTFYSLVVGLSNGFNATIRISMRDGKVVANGIEMTVDDFYDILLGREPIPVLDTYVTYIVSFPIIFSEKDYTNTNRIERSLAYMLKDTNTNIDLVLSSRGDYCFSLPKLIVRPKEILVDRLLVIRFGSFGLRATTIIPDIDGRYRFSNLPDISYTSGFMRLIRKFFYVDQEPWIYLDGKGMD